MSNNIEINHHPKIKSVEALRVSQAEWNKVLRLKDGQIVELRLEGGPASFSNGLLNRWKEELSPVNLGITSAAIWLGRRLPCTIGAASAVSLSRTGRKEAAQLGCKMGEQAALVAGALFVGSKLLTIADAVITAQLSSSIEGAKWKQFAGEELGVLLHPLIMVGGIRGIVKGLTSGKPSIALTTDSGRVIATTLELEQIGTGPGGIVQLGYIPRLSDNRSVMRLSTLPSLKRHIPIPGDIGLGIFGTSGPRGYPEELEGRSVPLPKVDPAHIRALDALEAAARMENVSAFKFRTICEEYLSEHGDRRSSAYFNGHFRLIGGTHYQDEQMVKTKLMDFVRSAAASATAEVKIDDPSLILSPKFSIEETNRRLDILRVRSNVRLDTADFWRATKKAAEEKKEHSIQVRINTHPADMRIAQTEVGMKKRAFDVYLDTHRHEVGSRISGAADFSGTLEDLAVRIVEEVYVNFSKLRYDQWAKLLDTKWP